VTTSCSPVTPTSSCRTTACTLSQERTLPAHQPLVIGQRDVCRVSTTKRLSQASTNPKAVSHPWTRFVVTVHVACGILTAMTAATHCTATRISRNTNPPSGMCPARQCCASASRPHRPHPTPPRGLRTLTSSPTESPLTAVSHRAIAVSSANGIRTVTSSRRSSAGLLRRHVAAMSTAASRPTSASRLRSLPS